MQAFYSIYKIFQYSHRLAFLKNKLILNYTISHFGKYGQEFNATSAKEYLEVGREIIRNEHKVSYKYKGEIRTCYVQYIGNRSSLRGGANRGASKSGFVGANSDENITTIHIKSGKEFLKNINGDTNNKELRPIYDD